MNNGEYFRHLGDVECSDAPFHYKRCGLENIFLVNGYEAECDEDDKYVTVLDVDGLHRAIGMHLVTHRKVLAPKEIRFLRKTLNLTQGEMGRLIGQSDQQIARWEKGENNISGPADRLLRIMFAYTLEQADENLDLPMDFLSRLDGLDAQPEEVVSFANDGADWRERALA